MAVPLMSAERILALLAVKHSGDVFVPECKTGPTLMGAPPRLDAWVMKRSWTNEAAIGYEIKVTRQDFLRDEKWRTYLDYCHQFSFVVAPGVCDPSEVPPDVGLLVASKNCKMLLTKKKAPHRGVCVPDEIYRYILMWRTRVTRECIEDDSSYWKQWLATKKENRQIGREVASSLKQLIVERIEAVEKRNIRLVAENEALQQAKTICEELGVDVGYAWSVRSNIERAIERCNGGDVARKLDAAVKALEAVKAALPHRGAKILDVAIGRLEASDD